MAVSTSMSDALTLPWDSGSHRVVKSESMGTIFVVSAAGDNAKDFKASVHALCSTQEVKKSDWPYR